MKKTYASPELLYLINSNFFDKSNKDINYFKSDTFSLGLCILQLVHINNSSFKIEDLRKDEFNEKKINPISE